MDLQVQEATQNVDKFAGPDGAIVRELSELQLALVGGGNAGVIIA